VKWKTFQSIKIKILLLFIKGSSNMGQSLDSKVQRYYLSQIAIDLHNIDCFWHVVSIGNSIFGYKHFKSIKRVDYFFSVIHWSKERECFSLGKQNKKSGALGKDFVSIPSEWASKQASGEASLESSFTNVFPPIMFPKWWFSICSSFWFKVDLGVRWKRKRRRC
jgi:hypothetical protein